MNTVRKELDQVYQSDTPAGENPAIANVRNCGHLPTGGPRPQITGTDGKTSGGKELTTWSDVARSLATVLNTVVGWHPVTG